MARHLVAAGYEVSGWARRTETVVEAAAAGITMTATLAEMAHDREVVITMLTASKDLIEVAIGEGGLVAQMAAGSVLVDMSTVSPEASREVAAACSARAVAFLDAPVSGGSFGALQATLSIMVGGEAATLERVRPLLEVMGDPERIFHVGPVGAGEVVKLVNNMLVGTISAATLEALLVGARAGVPVQTLVDVVAASSGGSTQLTGQLVRRGLAGDFGPGFMTDLLVKDLRLAADLAEAGGRQIPLARLALEQFEGSQRAGHGRDDYSALLLELEGQDEGGPVRLN